jgi:hypothetical protein
MLIPSASPWGQGRLEGAVTYLSRHNTSPIAKSPGCERELKGIAIGRNMASPSGVTDASQKWSEK